MQADAGKSGQNARFLAGVLAGVKKGLAPPPNSTHVTTRWHELESSKDPHSSTHTGNRLGARAWPRLDRRKFIRPAKRKSSIRPEPSHPVPWAGKKRSAWPRYYTPLERNPFFGGEFLGKKANDETDNETDDATTYLCRNQMI